MTETQLGYGKFTPYNTKDPDYITIQRWHTGFTACVMTERKTYRLFNSDLNNLWIDIMEKINADDNTGKSI